MTSRHYIHDVFTFSIRRYSESHWGTRILGPSRYALDLGRTALILELWWAR